MSRDAKLREEIDGISAKFSAGYDELNRRLDALQRELAAVGRPAAGAGPDLPPPGFDPAALGEQVREGTEATSSLATRVHEVEGKMGTHERAIKDAQSKIDQLHLRGADPMAGGNDSWAEGRQRQQKQQRPETTEPTPGGPQHFHMPSGDPPLRT